jgi:glycosyltransferase involved in cell wall biosynthesis
MSKKILIISHDKVGPSMAGPGIRYHQIATELSNHFDTTLGVFNPSYIDGLNDTKYTAIDIKTYDFQSEFIKFDAIFALWLSKEMIEFSKNNNIQLIFDLYAPVPIEDYIGRKYSLKTSASDDKEFLSLIDNYRYFLSVGDFFVCSNKIQKDMWMGFAFSGGALTPGNTSDFDIENRISLLPMGINLLELDSISNRKPLREEFPEIKSDDFVIVWTGGIWDWFDGTTPVQAVAELVKSGRKNVKLVFLGTKHPNPDIPEMGETVRTVELSKKLGLYGKNIFFREGWVDYNKRLEYLNEANLALYAHKSELEARYSHRTRVLDHILIGLPTIATKGDYLTDLIENNRYGLSVKPQDKDELVKSLNTIIDDKKLIKTFSDNLLRDRSLFTWEQTTKNLVEFLKRTDTQVRKLEKSDGSTTQATKTTIKLKLKKYTPARVKRVIKRFM